MASIRGTNRRVAAAQERINAAAEQLVEKFGIEADPLPVFRRNPNRQASEQAEWMADVLEKLVEFGAGGVIDLVNPSDQADEGEEFSEGHVWANPGFIDMSRADLEKVATDWYQLDPADYPDDMALRQALVAAYEKDTDVGEEPLQFDFGSMKRSELDEVAPMFGIDPSQYRRVDDLRTALTAAGDEE